MILVDSSAIRAVEYNQYTEILKIWFTSSGGPYDYYAVPAWKYREFLAAASLGTYFNLYIRDQHSINR